MKDSLLPTVSDSKKCKKRGASVIFFLAVAAVVVVMCALVRKTRECSNGTPPIRVIRHLFTPNVVPSYDIKDNGEKVATVEGKFPRSFHVVNSTTSDTIATLECSGMASCFLPYPTYALKSSSHGAGTLEKNLELLPYYTLKMESGYTLNVEIDLSKSILSSSYIIRNSNGDLIATVQKMVGGCSVNGIPGMKCFSVCMEENTDQWDKIVSTIMCAALDQNEK
jgi:hypothetical protein